MHHFSETLAGRALARKEGGWRGGVASGWEGGHRLRMESSLPGSVGTLEADGKRLYSPHIPRQLAFKNVCSLVSLDFLTLFLDID